MTGGGGTLGQQRGGRGGRKVGRNEEGKSSTVKRGPTTTGVRLNSAKTMASGMVPRHANPRYSCDCGACAEVRGFQSSALLNLLANGNMQG